jgi:hypothetical protein
MADDHYSERAEATIKGLDEAEELAAMVTAFSEQFDMLCQERHDVGEEKYGVATYLGNDVIRMMLEELADTANYCRYQSVKLMILQNHLDQLLNEKLTPDEQDNLTIGVEAFKGTKDVGWQK